ncbi:hypothetical protein ACFFIX_19420 [Metabacillus herbersteinensis]|uniref:Uncharacterized protein n=1 Tax=Metabacillus herbersteinensis TaxID=283816 RepID=A0ABV6GKA2_9BACI
MIVDFHTKNSKYTIGDGFVLRNDEIVAQGNAFIFQLLLGYPAYLIITGRNPFEAPTRIKTSIVTSLLPQYEFFDGNTLPEKRLYKHLFSMTRYSNRRISFITSAVDEAHAQQLLNLRYGNQILIHSTDLLNTVKHYA